MRGAGSNRIDRQGEYLADLVYQLDGVPSANPDVTAYLELLDRVLEDRRISDLEAETLAAIAADWGLSASQIDLAHEQYFEAVMQVAMADGVVSELERSDLRLVASLLRLEPGRAEFDSSDTTFPSVQPTLSQDFAGQSVCFTGALVGRVGGKPISRVQAKSFAESAGLVTRERVTKDLELLVVADPDSQSGKARKARGYGTRVIAEAVFWSSIGVVTDN